MLCVGPKCDANGDFGWGPCAAFVALGMGRSDEGPNAGPAEGRAEAFADAPLIGLLEADEGLLTNEGLLARLKDVDVKMASKAEEVEKLKLEKLDLEEMNRDLSFAISGASKLQELKEQGEDIEGIVEVGAAKGKGRRRKK